MKTFVKKFRMLACALAVALVALPALSLSTSQPAAAYYEGYKMITMVNPTNSMTSSGGAAGSSIAGVIVAGIFVSVISIMICAALTGAEYDRELTFEEAALAGLIPLGCLLAHAAEEQD